MTKQVTQILSPPTLESMKHNSYIQAQVEHRLKQIADMSSTGTDNKLSPTEVGLKPWSKIV